MNRICACLCHEQVAILGRVLLYKKFELNSNLIKCLFKSYLFYVLFLFQLRSKLKVYSVD